MQLLEANSEHISIRYKHQSVSTGPAPPLAELWHDLTAELWEPSQQSLAQPFIVMYARNALPSAISDCEVLNPDQGGVKPA
jgi:hypothetical protein